MSIYHVKSLSYSALENESRDTAASVTPCGFRMTWPAAAITLVKSASESSFADTPNRPDIWGGILKLTVIMSNLKSRN